MIQSICLVFFQVGSYSFYVINLTDESDQKIRSQKMFKWVHRNADFVHFKTHTRKRNQNLKVVINLKIYLYSTIKTSSSCILYQVEIIVELRKHKIVSKKLCWCFHSIHQKFWGESWVQSAFKTRLKMLSLQMKHFDWWWFFKIL